jgi:ArsR family transcriptional regulator, arsenate/arsenite/antimonite-responsive transcriptional repressor
LHSGFDIGQYRSMSKPRSGPDEGCGIAALVREPLSASAAAQLAVILKALADPIRLRLMSLIASHHGGEACVCDISVGIALSQPTISHHLKVLRTAGLLASERRGSWVYYRVEPAALRQLSQAFGSEVTATAGAR